MAITAADVKNLREMTGAGMMDCKKALTETDGDFDAAVEFLRKKGLATAEKKAGRIAAEGIVTTVVSDDNKDEIKSWDGKLPTYMAGEGATTVPVLQLGTDGKTEKEGE